VKVRLASTNRGVDLRGRRRCATVGIQRRRTIATAAAAGSDYETNEQYQRRGDRLAFASLMFHDRFGHS